MIFLHIRRLWRHVFPCCSSNELLSDARSGVACTHGCKSMLVGQKKSWDSSSASTYCVTFLKFSFNIVLDVPWYHATLLTIFKTEHMTAGEARNFSFFQVSGKTGSKREGKAAFFSLLAPVGKLAFLEPVYQCYPFCQRNKML